MILSRISQPSYPSERDKVKKLDIPSDLKNYLLKAHPLGPFSTGEVRANGEMGVSVKCEECGKVLDIHTAYRHKPCLDQHEYFYITTQHCPFCTR